MRTYYFWCLALGLLCLVSLPREAFAQLQIAHPLLVPEIPKPAPANSNNFPTGSQLQPAALGSDHIANLMKGLSGGKRSKVSGASAPCAVAQAAGDASADPAVSQAESGNGETINPSGGGREYIGPARRGKPAPLDAIFPGSEYIGVDHMLPIGVPDTGAIYPLEKMLWKNCPFLRKARIRIYGWGNPGWGYSTSRASNVPNSYYIVPRKVVLDQAVLRIERVPDTVQTEHCDWGFRVSGVYGIDPRYTVAQGYYPATREILLHNAEYAFDPVELYGNIYIPRVLQGMNIKFGRFISPPDIEAQLAPDNFLWTHSQMFTVDCYTQTGFLSSIKLNNDFTLQAGMHAGDDIAPWDRAAIPSAEVMLRWTSKNNNDSLYGGIDSINNGRMRLVGKLLSIQANETAIANYENNTGGPTPGPAPKVMAHDNLQQFNITWSHRFNRSGTIVTMTEAYLLFSKDSLQGGTVNNGPPRRYNALTGPGAYLPGYSYAGGFVNYTAWKVSPKDYICIRPIDYLLDQRGWRTGFPTTYSSWTVGWCHRFSDLLCIRPEIRYDRALSYHDGSVVKPYDNGTRRYQFTLGLDVIQRF